MAKEFIAFVFTTKSTTTTATPLAVQQTMEDAVGQAREEIWLYHTMHAFAARVKALTIDAQ
jgi:hypothetical protein